MADGKHPLDPPGLKHSNDGQDFMCPGPVDGTIEDYHDIKTVATVYGWRAVCREHRRVWSWVRGDRDIVEDKYADGGMIGAHP